MGVACPLEIEFVNSLTSVCSNENTLESSETFINQNTTDTSDSSETCRFNVVCAHCSTGCGNTPTSVDIDNATEPVCTELPQGVQPSSSSVTLAEFNLMAGYYRVSNDSRNVLECYQADACEGGVDATNYCAAGYEGPCECKSRNDHALTR